MGCFQKFGFLQEVWVSLSCWLNIKGAFRLLDLALLSPRPLRCQQARAGRCCSPVGKIFLSASLAQ